MRHLYPPPETPLRELPYEIARLHIERRDFVQRISDAFERRPSRPILLYGAEGCGTTELALRYAKTWAKEYKLI